MAQKGTRLECLTGLLNHPRLLTTITVAHVAASTSKSPALTALLVAQIVWLAVAVESIVTSGPLMMAKNSFIYEMPFL